MSANGLKTIELTDRLPKYGYPVNRTMISLDDSRLMATIHLKGMPFESESESTLNNAFLTVKGFLNQLAKLHGNNLGVWTHIVKRKDELDSSYQFDSEFMQSFSDKYISSFSGQRFFKTEYYITFVFKYKKGLSNGIGEFEDLLKIAKSVLKRFDCSILHLNDDGTRCENIEFLSYLLNNKQKPYPLTESKVVNVIGHSDWHFGYDLLEIRNADSESSTYATFFELDGYPLTTSPGMWDFVLTQQCEFVLTQSMILMKSMDSIKLIDKQANLVSSGDNAEHELQELADARDYVATSEISFGDYHCSLAVFGDSQEDVIQDGADLSGQFMERGTMLKRANLKSQFSFLSMLPASTARVMPSPRTTTNLACTWSLHNYSQGKKSGNPIGDGSALMHMGSMAINGCNGCSNFKHIIFKNGAHDSVGGQKTEGFNINFENIAVGCNYNIIKCNDYNKEDEIVKSIGELLSNDGPTLLELRCKKGARSDLGRPENFLKIKETFYKEWAN